MAKILEVSRVTPFTDDSPEYSPVSELSLPLTFCDAQWFKFPPVERLFFYSLAVPKETLMSSVLPRLKRSLSLALRHFLPVAGTLTWPRDSPKPLILYRARDDAVSLSVAESDAADFDVLCGDQPREAASFRSLVPELAVTLTGASVVSLRVTLFPDKGFCIGVTSHHAVLDGKSTTMFVKSWAHLNNNAAASLPPDLTPFLDRSAVRDPRDLVTFYLNWWLEITESPGRDADPKLFEFIRIANATPDLVRATFTLSRADIASLRDKISSELAAAGDLRLSTFVVAFSHAVHCIVEATAEAGGAGKAVYGLTADLRGRLDPPLPENYFGNCVAPASSFEDLRATRATLAAVAASVGRVVGGFRGSGDVTVGSEERMRRFAGLGPTVRNIGVAGSPRFGVYGVDFGWGPPRKVEVASINGTGAVSMAESRDGGGGGGVEIGVVLKRDEMDIFASLFMDRKN